MDHFAQIVLGSLLALGGGGYIGLRILSDAAGDPDQGFWRGWGPVLIGLLFVVLGVLFIVL